MRGVCSSRARWNGDLPHTGHDFSYYKQNTVIRRIERRRREVSYRTGKPARAFDDLIDSDIGRPVSDIVSKLNYPELADDVEEVLKTLASKEREVKDLSGLWYNMRIMPYRTFDNVIDGVVVTFMDITDRKKATFAAEQMRILMESMLEYLPAGITVNGKNVLLQVVSKGENKGGQAKKIPLCDQMEKCEILETGGSGKPSLDELPIARALKGETINGEAWKIRHPDRSVVKVRCDGGPVRDKNGEIIGAIIAWRSE